MVHFGINAERYPELQRDRLSYNKILKVSGDLRLAPHKVRRRLGSEMSQLQQRAQARQEIREHRVTAAFMHKRLTETLSTPPNDNQLGLPKNVVGPVSPKALAMFGDDTLNDASLRQIPMGAKVTPKVLKVFGCEPSLLQPKARGMLFSQEEVVAARRASTLSTSSTVSSSSTFSFSSFRERFTSLRYWTSEMWSTMQRQLVPGAV